MTRIAIAAYYSRRPLQVIDPLCRHLLSLYCVLFAAYGMPGGPGRDVKNSRRRAVPTAGNPD
jgi:hypothetical protein